MTLLNLYFLVCFFFLCFPLFGQGADPCGAVFEFFSENHKLQDSPFIMPCLGSIEMDHFTSFV